MGQTVHDSKALIRALKNFISERVCVPKFFDVSDVKSDGTVFVKFRSSPAVSALEFVSWCRGEFYNVGMQYVQESEVQLRLAIEQFPLEEQV